MVGLLSTEKGLMMFIFHFYTIHMCDVMDGQLGRPRVTSFDKFVSLMLPSSGGTLTV